MSLYLHTHRNRWKSCQRRVVVRGRVWWWRHDRPSIWVGWGCGGVVRGKVWWGVVGWCGKAFSLTLTFTLTLTLTLITTLITTLNPPSFTLTLQSYDPLTSYDPLSIRSVGRHRSVDHRPSTTTTPFTPLTLPPPPPPLLSQINGYTALHNSANGGNDPSLKLLLEAGAKIEAKDNVREGWGAVLAVAREVAVVGWW